MAEEEKQATVPESSPAAQPGSIITPGNQPPLSPPEPSATSSAKSETPSPAVEEVSNANAAVLPNPEPNEINFGSEFVPSPAPSPDDNITWTASEFIAHHKSVVWFLTLGAAAVVTAATVWVLTKDVVSTLVIVVGAAALGFYGARQPRPVAYELDFQGITIGGRHHAISEFRSFAILPEGAFSSIVFMPLKRFAPLTTIYYAPEDEATIIDMLSNVLPMEERNHDMVDRLMHRIRF